MKPLLAAVAALTLVLSFGPGVTALPAQAGSGGVVVQQNVLPAAPQKTTKPKPGKTPSPTATPAAATTPTSRQRSAAEEEGDRWVQIALVAGGGLLGCVIVFFGIGALVRRRPRSRA